MGGATRERVHAGQRVNRAVMGTEGQAAGQHFNLKCRDSGQTPTFSSILMYIHSRARIACAVIDTVTIILFLK